MSGQIVDLHANRIFSGTVGVQNGIISSVKEENTPSNIYILPGFIDAHIHIESSMLVPSEFARLATVHGTVATVSDPHEIANVLGIRGVRFMIENGKQVPFHFNFGASPCVPATSFETAGAVITPDDIRSLFKNDHLKYLSEMMNFPGVLTGDHDVMAKIQIAKEFGLPIDGHAPALKKERALKYIRAGISTDHECFTLDEALEKIKYGMKIIIREGSAAKNYDALHPLIKLHPEMVMFCNDDKHPDELKEGHINTIVRKSVELGYDLMDVLRCACLNPIKHYKLDVGTLKTGDQADFIIVDNLKDFNVKQTYIKGQKAAYEGRTLIESVKVSAINYFNCTNKTEDDFKIQARAGEIQVIRAIPGELVTEKLLMEAKEENGLLVSDIDRDLLKLTVVNRYKDARPAVAFINGFNLKRGAIASSVAHDSHNIIAVGTDDASICKAVNAIIDKKGGIAVVENEHAHVLPLQVAGLMSTDDAYKVASDYAFIKKKAKSLGSDLPDPFMTLSFMALLVIPSLKLSDLGLFDGDSFSFTNIHRPL